ncbi:SGNH/GDSL hydrolase family protein [Maridesulfovibrio sp.]|uniref:SGNH/GDSL hydrolase family protein n=1 Tax=Maridesulfovibrio sp. TaxID=2795000 RepID=UPI002A1880F9|nr:SGNH/GDSL hydrolase family protein [Maridesulfovibrio sp.]
MDFLSRAVAAKGLECTYRALASPLTINSSPGTVPADLAEKDSEFGLDEFMHGRSLRNQFALIDPDDPQPELIVLNLFHETGPLFINNGLKYIFFIDPRSWTQHPQFESWMKAGFGMIGANPATYLKRYGEMLSHVRRQFPTVPILVVSRLSHYPAFGPEPYSYLAGWGDIGRSANSFFRVWEAENPGLTVLDMDRVFGGIWAESDKRIESHCPFLKFKLTEKDDVITGLHAARDVEHIGSMWSVIAGKVAEFISAGRVTYAENEKVSADWSIHWRPEKSSENELLEMLASGANYRCARAVGSFFLDLENDYTELLVRTAAFTPVCHNTLHMIKTYGRIWRNPLLADWCRVHRDNAAAFTGNGPLYTRTYLERIGEIEKYALGG